MKIPELHAEPKPVKGQATPDELKPEFVTFFDGAWESLQKPENDTLYVDLENDAEMKEFGGQLKAWAASQVPALYPAKRWRDADPDNRYRFSVSTTPGKRGRPAGSKNKSTTEAEKAAETPAEKAAETPVEKTTETPAGKSGLTKK